MSKFSAHASRPFSNSHGIRLQTLSPGNHQIRQQIGAARDNEVYYLATVAAASSTVAGFEIDNILDGNPESVWSSSPSSQTNSAEWLAFWTGKKRLNCIALTPRRKDGVALCFPETIEIHYSAGVNDWKFVREVNLRQPAPINPITDTNVAVIISLDRTIETDGFLIKAKRLRTDDFGNYYFQVADARAGLQTWNFDEDKARSIAAQFPSCLFFLGDEPDVVMPADEFAKVYERFFEVIKSGSSIARVSPTGITFANDFYGETYLNYASSFVRANRAPVDEWRFHNFYWPSTYNSWESEVKTASDWCRSHGAPMVLGSFGSPGTDLGDTPMYEFQERAMRFISSDPGIVEAVWYRFDNDPQHPAPHYLWYPNGALTPVGELFVQLM